MCTGYEVAAVVAAGASIYGATRKAPSPPTTDPEADRLKAQSDATTRANALLVQDQRRRRSQRNLLSLGASADDTLGAPGQRNVMAGGAATGAAVPGGYTSPTVLGAGEREMARRRP